jgi:hypothetical protein
VVIADEVTLALEREGLNGPFVIGASRLFLDLGSSDLCFPTLAHPGMTVLSSGVRAITEAVSISSRM